MKFTDNATQKCRCLKYTWLIKSIKTDIRKPFDKLITIDNSIFNIIDFINQLIEIGVMNGPLKFLSARKILHLLDLLAKFKRVLACSCSPNFCSCSHARFLVSIARNFVNPSLG